MVTNSCAFATASSSTADYKLVTATCWQAVTGRVIVVDLGLAVDGNRDGKIRFDAKVECSLDPLFIGW